MPLFKLLLLLFAVSQSHALASPSCPELSPWLSELSEQQRLQAQTELSLAEKNIQVLRQKLRKKMAELRLLRYDRQSSPETLPRLGRELMELRQRINEEHKALQGHLCECFGSMPNLDELQNLLQGQLPNN